MSTVTRVARCVGPDAFAPYLPQILPVLVEMMQLKPSDAPSVERLDGEEAMRQRAANGGGGGGGALDDAEHELAIAAMANVSVDVITVRSEAMREKALACQTTWQLFDDLGAALVPYIAPIIDVVLPLIEFEHSEEVRAVSVSIVPKMLIALCEGSQQCASEAEASGLAAAATALLSSSFPLLLRAVQQEDTVDVLGMTIEAIAGSTRACDEARGAGIALHFPPQFVTPAAEVLAKVLRGALARRAAAVLERSRRRGSGGSGSGSAGAGAVLAVDEGAAAALLTMGMNEIEEAIRVEEQIFESVVESNSALARTLGARCVVRVACVVRRVAGAHSLSLSLSRARARDGAIVR